MRVAALDYTHRENALGRRVEFEAFAFLKQAGARRGCSYLAQRRAVAAHVDGMHHRERATHSEAEAQEEPDDRSRVRRHDFDDGTTC
jgi:hypothetical protein